MGVSERPLHDRDAAIETLDEALFAARDGHGALLVVEGAAGGLVVWARIPAADVVARNSTVAAVAILMRVFSVIGRGGGKAVVRWAVVAVCGSESAHRGSRFGHQRSRTSTERSLLTRSIPLLRSAVTSTCRLTPMSRERSTLCAVGFA